MAKWSELMRSQERRLRISGKIVFGNGAEIELSGDHIAGITIDEGADGALMPGDVLSAVCRADLVNDGGQWLEGGSCLGFKELVGATFMPEIIVSDGENEYARPLGVYQVESAVAVEKEAKLRITAHDSIAYELGGAFSDTLQYPASIADIWRHAVGQTRYVWDGDVPCGNRVIGSRPEWGGISVRQALGHIAAAVGCFVCVDRAGSLRLMRVWDGAAPAVQIDASAYMKLESDSASFGPVDALAVLPSGADAQEKYYYASEERTQIYPVAVKYNPLFVSGDAGTDALAQDMLDNIAGYRLSGMSFDWRGDPEVGIGQKIILIDTAGRNLESVITRQSMKYSAGFSASCRCSVPENSTAGVMRALTPEGGLNAAALVGAVNGGLISAGSITASKLAAGSVTAEKLAVGAMEAQVVSALTAKLGSLTAEDIQTDTLAAALAKFTVLTAGTASFDKATVQHLVAEALNLQFGTAEQVFIRNLAVEYVQMVGAAIGNLCIKASDGNYYSIDVDEYGNVTAALATVSDGEINAGQTESGRVILETDITAANLNTSNLLATCALINKIDAARIDVDQLWAREAFISHLNTADISSNETIRIISQMAESADHNAAAAVESVGAIPNYVEIQPDGLYLKDQYGASTLKINSASVSIGAVAGEAANGYSRLAANYVQFGNYQLRKSADGGLIFKLKEE